MKKQLRGLGSAALALLLLIGAGACSPKEGSKTPSQASDKPAASSPSAAASGGSEAKDDQSGTYIADREIVVQAYAGDVGRSLPADINATPVGKELTKRTGIRLKVQYTPGQDGLSTMTTLLASGNIPDVIVSYLNNSARKEFPLLYKAAKEGIFADLTEPLKNSKVYSKYFEDGYLPKDTKQNIMFRKDLPGTYLVHLSIPREDTSMKFDPEEDYIGGMYIQRSIAEALKIDPREIHTLDQFRDLLVKIQQGGFKDENGQPVVPLGPKFWGGSPDALAYCARPLTWGVSDGYNITDDGKILHESQTDYAWAKVKYVRGLLADGLMNREFFTMDESRANEVSFSKNSAIIGDVHNYQPIIYRSDDWLPLGPLNDVTGKPELYAGGKNGYGVFAVSAKAEKPEEIVKYFDYLSTKEGKTLAQYGIEGEHYTLNEQGQPRATEQVVKAINDGDEQWLLDQGAGFGGSGFVFMDFCLTDLAAREDFGEIRPGASGASSFEGAVKIANYAPQHFRPLPGLAASAYLNSDEMQDVYQATAMLDYKQTLVQAMYASSDEEAQQILKSFRQQLEASNIQKYLDFLEKMYKEDPESLALVPASPNYQP